MPHGERVRRGTPQPSSADQLRAPGGAPALGNAAAARMLQRTMEQTTAKTLVTPLGAYKAYFKRGKAPELPESATRSSPVKAVPRPERAEARISVEDLRADDRKNTGFTGKITGLAKVEQYLTQGAVYGGAYHGGHLIADQLSARDTTSFTFENVAPQWASFNTPAYANLERKIRELVTPPPPPPKGASKRRRVAPPPAKVEEMLVTAKLTYGPDLKISPAWLNLLGISAPPNGPDLTFPRRIPHSWTLRARVAMTPPPPPARKAAPRGKGRGRAPQVAAPAPAPRPAKPDWRGGLQPTAGEGFKLATNEPFEKRAAGVRQPSGKDPTKFPFAYAAAAKMWKLRAVQWVPEPSLASKGDVQAVVHQWFPTFAKLMPQQEQALVAREQALDVREQQVAAREQVVAARLAAHSEFVKLYRATRTALQDVAKAAPPQPLGTADRKALRTDATVFHQEMMGGLDTRHDALLELLQDQGVDLQRLANAIVAFTAMATELPQRLTDAIAARAAELAHERALADAAAASAQAQAEAEAAARSRALPQGPPVTVPPSPIDDVSIDDEEEEEDTAPAPAVDVQLTVNNPTPPVLPQAPDRGTKRKLDAITTTPPALGS